MIAQFTWLIITSAIHSALPAVHDHAFNGPLMHYVVESEGNRPLPQNITLSRRAYDFALYFRQRGDLDRALKALDASLRFDPSYALLCGTMHRALCAWRSARSDSRCRPCDPVRPQDA